MGDYRNLLNALMMQQRQRYAVGGAVAPAAASGMPAPMLAGAGAPVATPTQSQAMASMPMQGTPVGTAQTTSASTPGWFQNYAGAINAPQGAPAPMAQIAAPPNGATPTSALTNAFQEFQQAQQFGKPTMAPPAPTQPGFPSQPGFMPRQGMPQGGMFGQGFPQNFNPQGSPMGGLNMFGQGQGMSPQYRQQLQSWRDTRPEYENGMDRDAFRQQMQTWRGQRPEFGAMQPSAPYAPDLNLPNGFGRPPIQQQGAQAGTSFNDYLTANGMSMGMFNGTNPIMGSPQYQAWSNSPEGQAYLNANQFKVMA